MRATVRLIFIIKVLSLTALYCRQSEFCFCHFVSGLPPPIAHSELQKSFLLDNNVVGLQSITITIENELLIYILNCWYFLCR